MASKTTKIAGKKKKVIEYTEPIRRSVLDVCHDNMKLASRCTFLNRIFYAGEHTLTGPFSNIGHIFQDIVEDVNGDYCDEKLSGFMLYYSKYFCHVIEGSESSIMKHFKKILSDDTIRSKILKWKILGISHNINQRFLDFWTTFTAKPPILMEKIDPDSDAESTNSKVLYCLNKLYKLGLSLRPTDVKEAQSQQFTAEELSNYRSASREIREQSRTFSISKSALIISMSSVGITHMDYLPEALMFDFLLQSRHLMDCKCYIDLYGSIPLFRMARDVAFPIPKDHIPKNIFEAEYDPVIDLPAKPDTLITPNI